MQRHVTAPRRQLDSARIGEVRAQQESTRVGHAVDQCRPAANGRRGVKVGRRGELRFRQLDGMVHRVPGDHRLPSA
jgi:hypothetical protein